MTDMNPERGELISALLDGEVSAAELGPAVEAASHLPQGLAVWHTYHVVGEALRGRAQVASGADSLFLARLRGRLTEACRRGCATGGARSSLGNGAPGADRKRQRCRDPLEVARRRSVTRRDGRPGMAHGQPAGA
jgi:sigma-E factor negative regulatory protein RseA